MGASTSTDPTDPTGFQLTYFQVNDIRVKNVFDELQRNTGESIRGDREMSTCEMLAVIREADQEEGEARRDRGSSCATTCAPSWRSPAPRRRHRARSEATAGLLWLDGAGADARPSEDGGSPEFHTGADRPGYPGPEACAGENPGPGAAASRAAIRPNGAPADLTPETPRTGAFQLVADRDRRSTGGRTPSGAPRATRSRSTRSGRSARPACPSSSSGIVMALRFPRGGIGLVIGGALLVFSVHYVGLTAGESLADRGLRGALGWPCGRPTSCSRSSD